MEQLLQDFIKARRVGVPLIAIETQDQFGTMQTLKKCVTKDVEVTNKSKKTDQIQDKIPPLISWDIVSGWQPVNEEGKEAIRMALGEKKPAMLTNPAEMLNYALKLGEGTILFLHNMHRFIGGENSNQAAVGQGLSNLRDQFKDNERTAVLLCPGIKLPEELKQDVLVLDEPLPSAQELRTIVTKLYEDNEDIAKMIPNSTTLDKAQEILRGLSRFSAETTTSLAITSGTGVLDLEKLWLRKRSQVEQTPGLSIYKGAETYADVRGVERVKEFISKLFLGKDAPNVLVFMDEIEKMFAGIQGDLSGTSQEQHGEFLKWTQDNRIPATMFVGHPGCSKSFIAKCCAGQFKVPMVELNMTALKGSLVGQTGLQTRAALKMISAIGQPLVMATCNSVTILPPELRRRFKLGTFFFGLPSQVERDAVWNLYMKKYGLSGSRPDDTDWTPAEIETCCEVAWRLNITPEQAAGYLVPISTSNPDKIKDLCLSADGKFLSASSAGVYKYDQEEMNQSAKRKINIAGVGEA